MYCIWDSAGTHHYPLTFLEQFVKYAVHIVQFLTYKKGEIKFREYEERKKSI